MSKQIFKCPPGQEQNVKNFQDDIFEKNEYNRFGICIKEGDVVLDAGANVGLFTQYALDRGASKVLAYESDKPHFKCYIENIVDDRVKCTLGSVSNNNYDLDIILKQHNIDKIDFAKIDIEGSEWDLFKFISVENLKRVNKWAIEFHTLQYNDNYSWNDKRIKLLLLLNIIEKFSVNGFRVKLQWIHKKWDVIHLFVEQENK